MVFGIVLGCAIYFPRAAVPVSAAMVLLSILLVEGRRFLHVHHRLNAIENSLRNIDSEIISMDDSSQPLRILDNSLSVSWDRGMIAPDLAEYLIQFIFLHRPNRILECGAGLSTQIISNCLKILGNGKLITLEHDPYWAEKVKDALQEKNLSGFAQVRFAPLKPLCINELSSIVWYSGVEELQKDGPYDFIFVDGPPAIKPTDPGREGALYALFSAMSQRGKMIMDDGDRQGERMVVRKWKEYFGNKIETKYIDLKKGLWVIEKLAK